MSFDYQKILETVVFSRIFWSDVTCFSRTETLERATATGNPQARTLASENPDTPSAPSVQGVISGADLRQIAQNKKCKPTNVDLHFLV